MRLDADPIDARLVRRLNRFVAEVEVAGRRELAHVPNSGRLGELLYPGAHVLLAPRAGRRKTAFDLLMARYGAQWVSIDSRLPPALLEEALHQGLLPEFGPVDAVHREVPYGASRLDLLIAGPHGPYYIETKSATLIVPPSKAGEGGVALFPDAPTTRGVRHLAALEHAARQGHRAAIVFVVQRQDATAFRPHAEADPAFAAALRRAQPAVRILAYACRVTRCEVALSHSLPVAL